MSQGKNSENMRNFVEQGERDKDQSELKKAELKEKN